MRDYRKEIEEGIRALQTEPQGNPFKTNDALAFLQRNLMRADSLLRMLDSFK